MARFTKHGGLRVRQRLGLPAKATQRMVDNALTRGKDRTFFSGSLRRYLDALWHNSRSLGAANRIIVYGNNIFLFAEDTLITTWALPPRFMGRKALKNERGRNGPSETPSAPEEEG